MNMISRIFHHGALASLFLTAPVFAEQAIFEIGTFNGNNIEFEQEGNNRNNEKFYAAPGDYTQVIGKSGAGSVSSGVEPLQKGEIFANGPEVEGTDPSHTQGFPRSLNGVVSSPRPVIDIFFQLDADQAKARKLIFNTAFVRLGTGSTHDVEFYLDGKPFGSRNGITADEEVKIEIPAGGGFQFSEGPHVISLVRTNPLSDPSTQPWLGIDAVSLSTP
ncbi:MAG: hypothetical protein BGO12_14405 [Verrucomicrobia bacterium 61-8]|nr:hypothetical protein [Verrucomicrobiota bacterium]OJV04629.1 MAG: hypothetical protein BGO12_14405 [Verrucomicrobia bacterium 61-8]